jgi:recombination protein RecR
MNDPIATVTALLARLPGTGEKSAHRLALGIVRSGPEYLETLAAAVRGLGSIRRCSICCDLTSEPTCSICSDAKRDPAKICVVAQPQDRMAFERAAVFDGRYHVLHGQLDPLAGVGPNQLTIRELLARLNSPVDVEVIVATGATVEGDATAMYLARVLDGIAGKVSRIATGVAVGGDLEHADMATLSRALGDRRTIR